MLLSCVLVVGVVGVGMAERAEAEAGEPLQGVKRVTQESFVGSTPTRMVRATCPEDKVVIGGGASLHVAAGELPQELTLQAMFPTVVNGRDVYEVRAGEVAPGVAGAWWVEAHAICAFEPDGYVRVRSPLDGFSSTGVDAEEAVCAAGQRALGSGTNVVFQSPSDQGDFAQVGLQVARPSSDGGITRAQAREDADGFTGRWQVQATAICADVPDGYEVIYGESQRRDSEDFKGALAVCTGDREILNVGAAVTTDAPGAVSLQQAVPLEGVEVGLGTAVENTPTNVDWDFMVVQLVCAEVFPGVD
jgi:hypothetical protein